MLTLLLSQMTTKCRARISIYYSQTINYQLSQDRMRFCSAISPKHPFFSLLVPYLPWQKTLPWEHTTRQPQWLGMMPNGCQGTVVNGYWVVWASMCVCVCVCVCVHGLCICVCEQERQRKHDKQDNVCVTVCACSQMCAVYNPHSVYKLKKKKVH